MEKSITHTRTARTFLSGRFQYSDNGFMTARLQHGRLGWVIYEIGFYNPFSFMEWGRFCSTYPIWACATKRPAENADIKENAPHRMRCAS